MDFMKLRAILTLDSSAYEKGLNDAEKTASGFGGKVKSAVSGVKKGMAVVGAAGAAAATAVGGIAKSAVDGYAESQQLAGGIETLFGEKNMGKVLKNANNAYKTAGMSANEYMNTTIQSAAAMINSLGNDQSKAADLMDMSITDMSDNVNKMGTSVEGVQDAYRGFSRGNFTMLDNLALGYSGTKEGMQQLLTKAEEVEKQQGRTTKYSIDNYSDIVQAIHVVQTEMGITGTTASEANKTISGSLSSMKTAWKNLLAGLADPNADLGQLISNMVESGKTALNNIIPAFKQAVKGVAELIKAVVPIIKEELPGIIKEIAPPLIKAAAAVISALISALPTLINVIIDMLPEIMKTIGKAVSDAWPEITKAVMEGLGTTGGKLIAGVLAAWTAIKGLGIVGGVANAISAIISLISILANPVTVIVAVIAAAAVAIIANWDKIKAAWGKAKEFFGKVWTGIQDAFKGAGEWLVDKFKKAKEGIINAWNNIGEKFKGFRDAISSKFSDIKSWVTDRFTNAKNAVVQAWSNIGEKFAGYRQAIASKFADAKSWITDKVTAAKEGILTAWSNIGDKFKGFKDAMADAFSNAKSWLADGVINAKKAILKGWSNIGEKFASIRDSLISVWDNIKSTFADIGSNLIKGLANGIVKGAKEAVEKAKGVASKVLSAVKGFFGVKSPSKVFHQVGGFLMEGLANGISDNTGDVTDSIGKMNDAVMSNLIDEVAVIPKVVPFTELTSRNGISGRATQDQARIIDGVTVNVYGAQGQDVRELADLVADRFQALVDRKAAVWA